MKYTKEQIQAHRLLVVEALESGEYEQGKKQLAYTDRKTGVTRYCCLGVACEAAIKSGKHLDTRIERGSLVDTHRYGKEGAMGSLPAEMIEWLDTEYDPELNDIEGNSTTAVGLNDGLDYTFDLIAAEMRRVWDLPER